MSDQGRPAQREFIDIQEVADEIRSRIEQRFPTVIPAGDNAQRETPSTSAPLRKGLLVRPLEVSMPATDDLLRQTSEGGLLVGHPPLAPQTVRGKVGQLLVSGVRRSLFWYTPQIHHFQNAVANAFHDQVRVFRELTTQFNALRSWVQTIAQQVTAVERIPKIERLTADFEHRIQALTAQLEAVRTTVHAEIGEVSQAYAQVESRATSHSTALQAEIAHREQVQLRLEAEIAAREQVQFRLDTEIAAREQADNALSHSVVARDHSQTAVDSLKTNLLIQAHRIDSLVQQLRSLNPEVKPDTGSRPGTNGGMQGQLYTDFEDVFRGGREDIKGRVSVYVARLKALGIGTATMPLIDVGCGRGEWLEVLAENGLTAIGVDSNHSMVEECTARKLPAHAADALEFLRMLPGESQGAVTGFHIVEHLSTDGLIQLLNETVRVLKPGGIAIFETPNPENLLVSSLTFHLDPTHRAPLPPALLQFLVESRGLCLPEILYLHPYPEAYKIQTEDGNPIATFLNHHFYGPQDYAIIARRL